MATEKEREWSKRCERREAMRVGMGFYDREADSLRDYASLATADPITIDEALDLANHTAEI